MFLLPCRNSPSQLSSYFSDFFSLDNEIFYALSLTISIILHNPVNNIISLHFSAFAIHLLGESALEVFLVSQHDCMFCL